METWIAFTLLAALMQSVRTAGQKRIASFISPLATTLVRYLFGLPFAVAYLYFVDQGHLKQIISYSDQWLRFFIYANAASVVQILATFSLVKVLSYRNFAVGTCFAKTEAVQTALLGVLFFSAYLTFVGWLAIALGLIGILIVSLPPRGYPIDKRVVVYGVLSGLGFAFTSVWIREASLALGEDLIFNAAFTLVYTVSIQTLICLAYLGIKQREQFKKLQAHLGLATVVGATSALGSIGWFTAMTLQNPAIVKSLGQVEFLVTLAITYFFFNERISRKEYIGMCLILASVLILLLY